MDRILKESCGKQTPNARRQRRDRKLIQNINVYSRNARLIRNMTSEKSDGWLDH